MATQGRARIEVGGRVFVTTMHTIEKAGSSSHLYQAVHPTGQAWFDRDPDFFSPLLNVLRTGVLYPKPDTPAAFDRLIEEALFYGVEPLLRTCHDRAPLNGVDLEKATPVVPSGVDEPRALAAGEEDGSLWVGHGCKITVYDWALRKKKTTVTELGAVEAMHRMDERLAACGAADSPGLHVYDVAQGVLRKTTIWTDANDPRIYNPIVHAVASNAEAVFASFESGQHLDNTVLMVDKATSQVVREIGRQNGQASHTKSATKLQWLPSKNLLFVGSVRGGSFGFSGYLRLWDVRSNQIVWDWKEPNFEKATRNVGGERDCFADMTVDEDLGVVLKVGVQSGALSLADMRNLDVADPWLELVDAGVPEKVGGGANKKLIAYKQQVFLSRGADVEAWSEVPLAESFRHEEKEFWETSFRRNALEHRRHPAQEVTQMVAGGDRLFIARKDLQGIEVWETRQC